MDKDLYRNVVFGILSWHKFTGAKVVRRTEIGKAIFDQGVVTVDYRQELPGTYLSDMMEDFAKAYGGKVVKEFDANDRVVPGSVRIEF
jgi:hypothetical protein